MFFKEAINNAAKYSGAKSVNAELRIKGNELNLSIADNGTGFDTRKTYKGNGLPNMQQRAAALNGTVAINSSEGTGTTIGLWARLPINREAN